MFLNIEAERARMRLTKSALAEKLQISLNTYKSYVSGSSIPSDKLTAMADLFGCSIDYLLGRKPNP